MNFATFHIHQTCVATTSFLQNINLLSKKVWAVHIKEKMSIAPESLCLLPQSPCPCHSVPSPYNVLYFLEGQVHKDSKLGIMTNMGKSRLAKVIFNNIHKISDACANSFDRYIMIAQCMRNIFTFY